MSRYKAYPEYKDSGINWLNNIPAHWGLVRFKNIFKIQKRIACALGHDVLSITQRGVKIKDTESGDGQLSMDYSKYQLVYKNDFAMNHMDLLTGYVDISSFNGVTSPDYRVFTLDDPKQHPKYFLYLMRLCYITKIFYPLGQGAAQIGRWRLPTEAFNDFVAPTPSYDEQQSIAAFLDYETAKIDALIEKQLRLIELLKEKRQAVISHAVTKGLNSNAPMNDSGVEWLGEIPAHWNTGKCGFYVSILSGYAFQSSGFSENEEDIKLLRGINVGVSKLKWDDVVYWKRAPRDGLDIYEMKEGDIVIGMDRPLISEGIRVAKVKNTDLPCLLLQRVASIKANDNLNADYFLKLLSSNIFAAHFTPDTTGVSVPHISPDQIGNFVIPIPPIDEQNQIVYFIDCKSLKLSKLIDNAEVTINLMQERRTALISAAVTGKIDVRDWRPAAA